MECKNRGIVLPIALSNCVIWVHNNLYRRVLSPELRKARERNISMTTVIVTGWSGVGPQVVKPDLDQFIPGAVRRIGEIAKGRDEVKRRALPEGVTDRTDQIVDGRLEFRISGRASVGGARLRTQPVRKTIS